MSVISIERRQSDRNPACSIFLSAIEALGRLTPHLKAINRLLGLFCAKTCRPLHGAQVAFLNRQSEKALGLAAGSFCDYAKSLHLKRLLR
jgi:hypothetical protein